MKLLSPMAVFLLCGFVGIVTHRLGLWLPFGIIGAIIVAGAQTRRFLDEVGAPNALATIADADLLRAYQRTDGVPGNRAADALSAEIERRGLDV
jgi:hypothetical protein